ncbi:Tim44-like domain-containing protein [Janthinobacterium sp. 17J80-10]|uniref:Tim44 domain-containing protein n=1 Tax=Janthinobacterium sp. 17J80-10 TaxID=2497863 RepID=UPI0010059EC5|nr:Tim44-like domain-containing protein [Janthinobacterium sp. 17J80-10]QAU33398.1 Tim44 domain-containing protein [Janthinobacterium sp. 17J80-10]
MTKCLNALLLAAAFPVAVSLHAQTADSAPGAEGALAQPPASLVQSLMEHSLVIGGVLLALVALMGLAIVLWRRSTGKGEASGFENTYDGGFDTIQPVRPPRKDPNLRPLSLNTVTGARTDTVVAPWSIPADFDVPRFLRKSKSAFVRLQTAWDQADLNDIRRFTSKELFGEFFRQINERDGAPNLTEVVTLGAELHSVETVDGYYIARVKFSGMIKEDAAAPVAPFSEIWILSKPLDGHRSWIVAGIEQH